MKVRALKSVAPGHGIFSPGAIFDLEDHQARQLIAAGVVESMEPPADLESDLSSHALDTPAKNRMQRRGARK